VITGATAPTSSSRPSKPPQGHHLTGGFQTNEVVLGKARYRGDPHHLGSDDTFTTIDKIELRMARRASGKNARSSAPRS